MLQKSFRVADCKFSGLYARRSNVDVGDPLHSVTNSPTTFGGAFEATLIGGSRLFCSSAEICLLGILGVLQHNPSDSGQKTDIVQRPKWANSRHYSMSSKTRISPPWSPSTRHSSKPSGFKRLRRAYLCHEN
jgi:hypothetical protein